MAESTADAPHVAPSIVLPPAAARPRAAPRRVVPLSLPPGHLDVTVVLERAPNMCSLFKTSAPTLTVQTEELRVAFTALGVPPESLTVDPEVHGLGCPVAVTDVAGGRIVGVDDGGKGLVRRKSPRVVHAAVLERFWVPPFVPLAWQRVFAERWAGLDWRDHSRGAPVHRMTLFVAMGGGKSLGSLFPAFSAPRPPRSVLIGCQNTQIGQWEATIRRMPLAAPDAVCVDVVGHTLLKNEWYARLPQYDYVILDESVVCRKLTADWEAAAIAFGRCARSVTCTGTLLVNGPTDMAGALVLNGEDVRVPRGRDTRDCGITWTLPSGKQVVVEEDAEWPARELARVFDGNVLRWHPRTHAPTDYARFYPRTASAEVRLPMSVAHMLYYLTRRNNVDFPDAEGTMHCTGHTGASNAYDAQLRSACNEVDWGTGEATKAVAVAEIVRLAMEARAAARDGTPPPTCRIPALADAMCWAAGIAPLEGLLPAMYYSSRLEAGVDQVPVALDEAGVVARTAHITGKVPTEERERARGAFNSGQLDLLLMSPAAALGTDLKGGMCAIINDTPDNTETENQIKGRLVRMGSHPAGHGAVVRYLQLLACFPTRQEILARDEPEEDAKLLEMLGELYGRREITWNVHTVRARMVELGDADDWMTVNESMLLNNRRKQEAIDRELAKLEPCHVPVPAAGLYAAGDAPSEARAAPLRPGADSVAPHIVSGVKKALGATLALWKPASVELTPLQYSTLIGGAIRETIMAHGGGRTAGELAGSAEFVAALKVCARRALLERLLPPDSAETIVE